jgi:hypothetical protein
MRNQNANVVPGETAETVATNKFTVEEMLEKLGSLEPNNVEQKSALFSQLYPAIVQAEARRVPQKKILEMLESFGLKLHPARYNELKTKEVALRDGHGERICCATCGTVLKPRLIEHEAATEKSANRSTSSVGDSSRE